MSVIRSLASIVVIRWLLTNILLLPEVSLGPRVPDDLGRQFGGHGKASCGLPGLHIILVVKQYLKKCCCFFKLFFLLREMKLRKRIWNPCPNFCDGISVDIRRPG
jgi:hypothetical protein